MDTLLMANSAAVSDDARLPDEQRLAYNWIVVERCSQKEVRSRYTNRSVAYRHL